MNDSEWNLTVGEIVAPFGLSGEMKVRLETDFPDRFACLKRVCIRRPGADGRLYEVAGARPHKGQVLLRLQGVTSIESAELLRNTLVQIQSSEAVKLPANEYYIYELIGCEVVTDSGRSLGCVRDVMRGAANDVYIIGSGKQELLLPAIQNVIKLVDTTARRIIVTPTPGLLPEDLNPAQES